MTAKKNKNRLWDALDYNVFRVGQANETVAANNLKVANDEFAKSLKDFTADNSDNLLRLIAVGYGVLNSQTQLMSTDDDRAKVAAVQKNYLALLGTAKQMVKDGFAYIKSTIDTTDAKNDYAVLPRNRGITQINSFIELMKECSVGQPESVKAGYDEMIELGNKTLRLAKEKHREIAKNYEPQIKQYFKQNLADMDKELRDIGFSRGGFSR
ncbi:MAG: hypothetical protein LBP75_02810 [Planctomycetota bacterium]|jgi:hypothetical protein|nr:hypothetical protein [Planctomycetota bacterium]